MPNRRCVALASVVGFFFFNDTATTEIYTLSLHDALPIYSWPEYCFFPDRQELYPEFHERSAASKPNQFSVRNYDISLPTAWKESPGRPAPPIPESHSDTGPIARPAQRSECYCSSPTTA